MQTADPDEPPMPVSGTKKSTAKAGKSEAAAAEPSREESGSSSKPSGGIAIPGLPGNVSADQVIDGAKKLKNLFGF
ncbi:MAG: hypothetical protein HXX19_16540 [Rhodoferax sp.]|nr:hypothetical protein [Rhodoferax sp.]